MPEPTADERDRAAVAMLLRYYSPRTGRWVTPTGEGWQPALAIEAVTARYERTQAPGYLGVIERSFARYQGRRSDFFDDNGWYLNAWISAYDAIGDPRYLDEAAAIFTDMTTGWDGSCGGGLWWTRDRTYKNAITNELFLLAAARLHRRNPDKDYRDWATRIWDWFAASGMINDDNLVNDGLGPGCVNNGQTTWTYNQGVILGGLAELWRITSARDLLDRAHAIAQASLRHLVDNDGVLVEPCEGGVCDGNQLIFKGIFAQGLARLYVVDPDPSYQAFLTRNADRLWAARSRSGRIGASWNVTPRGCLPIVRRRRRPNCATHASGALLFGAVAALSATDSKPAS
jgi:predicted alpha-1,6-mannanase (GH76 family)